MKTDPVCGRDLDPLQGAYLSEYNRELFFFCSRDCKRAFDLEPERYLALDEPRRTERRRYPY